MRNVAFRLIHLADVVYFDRFDLADTRQPIFKRIATRRLRLIADAARPSKGSLRMFGDGKRLTDDVRRWQREGWVTADGETQILQELSRRGSGLSLASALGILASVLLAFAVMSFVAAHWQDMSRLSRLSLLIGVLLAAYAAAGLFEARGKPFFADAAILFATGVFGASIMLIAQMFHIDGNPPDGVLAWALGALLAGVVLRSNPALAAAMVLFAVWAGMETGVDNEVHWPFLPAWAAVTAAFVWQRWIPGAHISGLALAIFVISLGYLLSNHNWHWGVAVLGALGIAASIAAQKFAPEFDSISAPALGYALAVAFAAMIALQFFEKTTTVELIVYAAITLAGLLAAIGYGLASGHRGAIWLGYIGFSIEVLAVYWKTVGSILDTALLFLIAGIIVAALSYMAWRLASRPDAIGGLEQGSRS